MLELSDPLWRKLDDAFRDKHVPTVLSALEANWNDDTANALFWENLLHQESCYGATYAVVPHLLNIAAPENNQHQRLEIGIFLGTVALCALGGKQHPPLPGLPETLEGWDRKLDCYRELVDILENPDRTASAQVQRELPRYKAILAIDPVSEADIEKIRMIREDFIEALPSIRELCERAFLENLGDHEATRYLLSGIAAADGMLSTARLLNSGAEGLLECSACHQAYEYAQFKNRIALYAENSTGCDNRAVDDYRDKEPSRCDGFIQPIDDCDLVDDRAIKLHSLSLLSADTTFFVRHFLGHLTCRNCGATALLKAG